MKVLALLAMFLPSGLLARDIQHLEVTVEVFKGKYKGKSGLLIMRDRKTEECLVLIDNTAVITRCDNIKVKGKK